MAGVAAQPQEAMFQTTALEEIFEFPRRIPDYALQFTEFNQVSTIGAFVLGFSQLLLLYLVVKAIKGGERASDRVWEGAHGLEWTLPSPAPYHSFATPPKIG